MTTIYFITNNYLLDSELKYFRRKNEEEKDFSISKNESIIYLTLSILGTFFLFKWDLFI